jgi:hypothetical protein
MSEAGEAQARRARRRAIEAADEVRVECIETYGEAARES